MMIAAVLAAVAINVAPVNGASFDTVATLALAAPPCGTPEAKLASACIRWTVVPCPPPWKPPVRQPNAPIRIEDFPPLRPAGCPNDGTIYP